RRGGRLGGLALRLFGRSPTIGRIAPPELRLELLQLLLHPLDALLEGLGQCRPVSQHHRRHREREAQASFDHRPSLRFPPLLKPKVETERARNSRFSVRALPCSGFVDRWPLARMSRRSAHRHLDPLAGHPPDRYHDDALAAPALELDA